MHLQATTRTGAAVGGFRGAGSWVAAAVPASSSCERLDRRGRPGSECVRIHHHVHLHRHADFRRHIHPSSAHHRHRHDNRDNSRPSAPGRDPAANGCSSDGHFLGQWKRYEGRRAVPSRVAGTYEVRYFVNMDRSSCDWYAHLTPSSNPSHPIYVATNQGSQSGTTRVFLQPDNYTLFVFASLGSNDRQNNPDCQWSLTMITT